MLPGVTLNSTTFGGNHNSLCVLESAFWLSLKAPLSCDSKTAAKPPSIPQGEDENMNLILAKVSLVTSSVGDRSRPWCQTGVIRGGLGIWHGNHPWRLEELDEVVGASGLLCMPCC